MRFYFKILGVAIIFILGYTEFLFRGKNKTYYLFSFDILWYNRNKKCKRKIIGR